MTKQDFAEKEYPSKTMSSETDKQTMLMFQKIFMKGYEAAQKEMFTLKDMIKLVNDIGFVKTTSEKLNTQSYQPFITDEDGQVWTINKEELLQSIMKRDETNT